jgi:SAM-dependent methyltransferase
MTMPMYTPRDLFKLYKKYSLNEEYSRKVPDVTKKRTIEVMNMAINCCESWGHSLDIGAGSGSYTAPLLRKFKQCTVVDVVPFKEYPRFKKEFPNFDYKIGEFETLSFTEKFDFILLADIFEHIPDIKAFMAKIAGLQNKGGVVYIMTPNPLFCGPAETSSLFYKRNPYGHQKHYLPFEVKEVVEKAGYVLVNMSYEEANARRKWGRRIVLGLSRRDRRWSDASAIYRGAIGPSCRAILKPFLWLIEKIIYRNELKHAQDSESTMSAVYIFKKHA